MSPALYLLFSIFVASVSAVVPESEALLPFHVKKIEAFPKPGLNGLYKPGADITLTVSK